MKLSNCEVTLKYTWANAVTTTHKSVSGRNLEPGSHLRLTKV